MTNTADEGRSAALQHSLRTATRASHHRIDHHRLLAPLVRPGLDLEHYSRVLWFFLWFYERLQPELAQALAMRQPDYPLGDRVTWLHADLACLGLAAEASCLDWNLPSLAEASALVGALYVVEGSTLGGQVISRRLRQSLEVTPTQGGRFFHGWGEETPQHWAHFWDFAVQLCPPGQEPEAAAAAVALFATLDDGLNRALRHWHLHADAELSSHVA